MTDRPTPVADSDSAPFWEGASEGELRIQRCRSCEKYIFYPRVICPNCMEPDPEWVTASGRGTVYSFTVVHRAPPGFAEEAPYAVGLIELEEGVRMLARLEGDDLVVGLPVVVEFTDGPDGFRLPRFVGEEQ